MKHATKDIPKNLASFITEGTPGFIQQRYAGLAARAATSNFGRFDDDVVVIDTETTGLSFSKDELIQIAAARVMGGKISSWYVTFVNPGKPIPEEIEHLTGISNDDVKDAPTPQEALAGLVEFVGASYLVAHNVGFDKTFTTKHPQGYPLLENHWIDTLDLARIALPRMSSHRLIDLVTAFDCPLSTHRADDDVASTCAMLRILLAAVDAMPYALQVKISGLADLDEWSTVEVFKFFAERNRQDAPDGQKDTEGLFSLRRLRAERVRAIERKPKNDAEKLVQDPELGMSYPTLSEVYEAFTKDGLVGRLYDDYEQRREQVSMAQAVSLVYEDRKNLTVEAGTGVGKSMAYLVPSVLLAKKNNITVGVATKTNALLDQLVYHELPALSAALGDVTYAPLKGFTHYLCLRRVNNLLNEGAQTKEVAGESVNTAAGLATLISFVEQSEYDDIDALKIDYRSVPRWSYTTSSHDCLKRKCPFYGATCFVHGARRLAESSDVVVTNHALLFCDLVTDGGLLPPVRHWVIDEAHGAEAEARKAFSLTVSAEELTRLAVRVSAEDAKRNPFVRAERRVVDAGEDTLTLLCSLTGKARRCGRDFSRVAVEFAEHMKDLLAYDPSPNSKAYNNFELWLDEHIKSGETFGRLKEYGNALCAEADRLALACQNLVAFLEDFENVGDVQREIASIAISCKEIIGATEVVVGPTDDRYAYAASLCRKSDRRSEALEALVVNVGEKLQETLYSRTHSVVFASATISIDGGFGPFNAAVGLGESEESRTECLQLASSFDFDHNMRVYVADDLPEPNSPAYAAALQQLLTEVHRAQHGSVLTLFTNRKEMESCHREVSRALLADDLRVVCQKKGLSVKSLRDEFIENESLSLFALKSFWEGFDAPGSTLKGVIIPRLPFSVPTDPLYCERRSRDDNAWWHYVLPAAVIDVKQAAGRLIRKADDQGFLLLADKRLLTKRYGRTFLNSLPSKNIKKMSCDEIVRDIKRNAD